MNRWGEWARRHCSEHRPSQVLREMLPPDEADDVDDEDLARDEGDSDGDQPRT